MRHAEIPVRQGPGLAEARAGERSMPRFREPYVDGAPTVLVSTRARAAVPDGAMPDALPALRDAFGHAGWTWEVAYSSAIIPAVLFAESAKQGRAGQVRKAAVTVDVVTLRIRCHWAAAYGRWDNRRWVGGGLVLLGAWRKLGTLESFRALAEV